MYPVLSFRNIPLSHINFDDFSYSISPGSENVIDQSLRESIARYGIFSPPVTRETSRDRYVIVAGRKRLLAFHSLHPEGSCNCHVIPAHIPQIEIFHILLEEIMLYRQVTLVEKALFLKKIAGIIDEKEAVKEFLPLLGLAAHPNIMKQTCMLLELEESIQRAIHQGYVNETVARSLIFLSSQDRMALFTIIASLRLSFSNQKKLLDICSELSSRLNTSVAGLLDSDEVHAILQHQNANPPQKTKNLMNWLARKHKPRSIKAEEKFNRVINAMHLPGNVSVTHTPYFEDDAVTLAITFRNSKSLQHAWDNIKLAIENDET